MSLMARRQKKISYCAGQPDWLIGCTSLHAMTATSGAVDPATGDGGRHGSMVALGHWRSYVEIYGERIMVSDGRLGRPGNVIFPDQVPGERVLECSCHLSSSLVIFGVLISYLE